MQPPGQQLRRIRERLGLRFRDVDRDSAKIAERRGSLEFHIGLSRLSDIENKGTLPTVYRLYSLAAIYKLEFRTLLRWYGIDLDELATDAVDSHLEQTTMLDTETPAGSSEPAPNLSFDPRQTVYLSRLLRSWGKLPAFLLVASVRPARHSYAFIGFNDRFMHPIIRPGSLVQIDPRKRKIATTGWGDEWHRPIYLIEHRNGFRCGWCSKQREQLILQPHPASGQPAEAYPTLDVEVLGQVSAVAFRFDPEQLPHTHSAINRG